MTRSFVIAVALLLVTIAVPRGQEASRLVKGWAALMQAVSSVQTFRTTGEWSAVHNEETIANSAIRALREETKLSSPAAQAELTRTLTTLTQQFGDIHVAADEADAATVRATLAKLLLTYTALKRFYPENTLAPARALAETYACAMHPTVTGKRGTACSKCGMVLEVPVRVALAFYGGADYHTVRARVRVDQPLQPRREVKGTLVLTGPSGQPLLLTDLRVVHTQPIHLLIADRTLTDYHHVHPTPTAQPGTYAFSFTPLKNGPYRAWADVQTTYAGFQEYAMAEIPSAVKPPADLDRTATLETTVDGLRYALVLEKYPVVANEPVRGRLRVTDAAGKPFAQLEPFMDAFSHIVGIHENWATVEHLHPFAARPPTATARGGPELPFQLYVAEPGFYRFFAQVQIKGAAKYPAFGVNVVAPPRSR